MRIRGTYQKGVFQRLKTDRKKQGLPYAYWENNPVNRIDPDGRLVWFLIPVFKGLIGGIVDAAAQATVSMANGQGFGKAMSNIDYTSVGASVVTSAITMPGMSTVAKGGTTEKENLKMNSIKSKKKKYTIKNRKHKAGWIIPIVLLLYILGTGGYKTYQTYILKKDGICTNAIAYHRYWGYRTVNTQYRFAWDSKTYEGESTDHADVRYSYNSIFKEADMFAIGDTIVVVFLGSNPNINRSNSIVKKDCDCE
jgi:hypothetical protein